MAAVRAGEGRRGSRREGARAGRRHATADLGPVVTGTVAACDLRLLLPRPTVICPAAPRAPGHGVRTQGEVEVEVGGCIADGNEVILGRSRRILFWLK